MTYMELHRLLRKAQADNIEHDISQFQIVRHGDRDDSVDVHFDASEVKVDLERGLIWLDQF